MALVTWDDIGGSLSQAEENIYGGMIPSEQGFPFISSWGEQTDNFESWSHYNEFINGTHGVENFYNNTDDAHGGYVLKSSHGAFQTGFITTLINAASKGWKGSHPTYGTTSGVSGANARNSYMSNAVTSLTEYGTYVIRIPYTNLHSGALLYDFVVLCSHGRDAYVDGYIHDTTISQYAPYGNTKGIFWQYCVQRYTIYPRSRWLSDGGFFARYLKDNSYFSVTDDVKNNLYSLINGLYVNGLGTPVRIVNMGDDTRQQYINTPDFQFKVNCEPLGSIRDNYYFNNAVKVYKSTLPIWSMDEDHSSAIIDYILNGNISETWYDNTKGTYEPVVNTQINDTTTIWNVQPMYDTNPICIVNYKTPALGASTSDVRSAWRGNIFIDSILNAGGSTLKQLTKNDIVLYDKPYTSHSAGMSMRYNRMVERAYDFIGYDEWVNIMHLTPPATALEGWWSTLMSPIIRLGMCVCTDNQISNIMYVDIHYDNTVQFEWGVLEDHGDNSTVNLYPKSTAIIESAGGISNIERPDADDGYTGVDTATEEENFDYDEGNGEYPDDTITPTSGTGVSVGGKFCNTYQVTTAQLKAISNYFWNDGSEGFISKYINAVNNPIESILSVGYMPVSVSNSVGTDNVYIGNVNLTEQSSDCTGYSVDNTTIKTTIGSIEIPEIYNSFLDYQPYTNLTIFLPFIGFKTLPPNLFMGKTLTVEYIYDLITGACKTMLSANGKFVISFDGDCMIRVPLTASNNSDVFMQRLRSAVEAVVTVASTAIGSTAITSGGGKHVSGERFGRTHREAQLGRAMRRTNTWSEDVEREPTTYSQHAYGGMVSQIVGSGLDIAMAKHTYETYGGASSATASVEPMSVYIIIDSPTVQYPATYNHNCGKPCELSKYLSSLKGYTEVDGGIDLSGIPCTEAERDEIHRLLVSGVYL